MFVLIALAGDRQPHLFTKIQREVLAKLAAKEKGETETNTQTDGQTKTCIWSKDKKLLQLKLYVR